MSTASRKAFSNRVNLGEHKTDGLKYCYNHVNIQIYNTDEPI